MLENYDTYSICFTSDWIENVTKGDMEKNSNREVVLNVKLDVEARNYDEVILWNLVVLGFVRNKRAIGRIDHFVLQLRKLITTYTTLNILLYLIIYILYFNIFQLY